MNNYSDVFKDKSGQNKIIDRNHFKIEAMDDMNKHKPHNRNILVPAGFCAAEKEQSKMLLVKFSEGIHHPI